MTKSTGITPPPAKTIPNRSRSLITKPLPPAEKANQGRKSRRQSPRDKNDLPAASDTGHEESPSNPSASTTDTTDPVDNNSLVKGVEQGTATLPLDQDSPSTEVSKEKTPTTTTATAPTGDIAEQPSPATAPPQASLGMGDADMVDLSLDLDDETPTPAALTTVAATEQASMTQPTAPADPIDPDLNQHITNLSLTHKETPSVSSPSHSPAKKKSKTSSKKQSSTQPAQGSILKSSRTAMERTPPHDHIFPRTILDASVQLVSDAEKDRYAEFIHSLGVILKNGRILDPHFVINPMAAISSLPAWALPKEVPSNMTELGRYVFISGTSWKFKNKGKSRQDNMIYFSFTISTDCDPETLCRDLGMEWGRQNGDRLSVKEVQCHDTITPIMFFRLWHDGPTDGLVEELKTILTEAWEKGRAEGDDALPANLHLPQMTFRKMVPALKGLNTHAFAPNIPAYIQANRKVLHLEVGRSHSDLVRTLVRLGKRHGCFAKMWGKHVHPTEVLDAKATRQEQTALGDIENLG